jgi:hypothetical protein
MALAHENKLIKQFYANLAGKPMIGFCCRKNFKHHGWYYPIICTYQRLWLKFFATEFPNKSDSHEQGNLDF